MSNWAYMADEEFTFYGVYQEFYEDVARNWKAASTKHSNDLAYDRIISRIPGHDKKPITSYTRKDYDAIIEGMIEKGQGEAGEPYQAYKESTLNDYRRLIYYVVEVAAEKGLCDNVLWESLFNPKVSSGDEETIAKCELLSKSLTIPQEKAVAQALLTNPLQSGQNMGLLLMYALGLRNAEACAVNFSDIKPMQTHPECKVVWIYKTTGYDSSNSKLGGKTKNADRIIPVPDRLAAIIEERRQYLQTNTDLAVDKLPIACVGEHWEQRCSGSHLTAAARELFQSIKMDAAQLVFVDSAIRNDEEFPFEEKDPTAYLFRRNFGTHLHILGLTEAEIAYVIGHDIEDPYETRNEFVNEEKLYRIKLKMDQRPLVNELDANTLPQAVSAGQRVIVDGSAKLQFPTVHTKVKLSLSAKEPTDTVNVKLIPHPKSLRTKKECDFYTSIPSEFERTVDVRKQYHRLYRIKQ